MSVTSVNVLKSVLFCSHVGYVVSLPHCVIATIQSDKGSISMMKRKESPWFHYSLSFSSVLLVIIPCSNCSSFFCGSLKHLVYSLQEDVFPATATLLVPSPLTVMEMDSVTVSPEWQERSVIAVLMDFTTLKKEAVLVCKIFADNCRFFFWGCFFLFIHY